MARPPILETERLRLEPLAVADAEGLFPLVDDPEVMADWNPSEANDPDMVAQRVAGQVEAMQAGRALHWAARTLGDGRFLGAFDLTDIDRRHRRAELSFTLGSDVWADGYPLEALRSIVAYAAASGLRRLSARTPLGNRRAEALLEALGFTEEGLVRGHLLKTDGERRDGRLFGLQL